MDEVEEEPTEDPRFEELFLAVTTPAQQEKVGRALAPILAGEPAKAAA